ncbi:MAG: hypothetical protein K0R38_1057 [Polyangiaceae bacterium]|jgi:hypothetical protein|nr:hypothetical protein [Polyangiaceae bacterium]
MSRLGTQHPSYLALDRAALGGLSSELSQHVSECDECRAYLETLAQAPPASGLIAVRGELERRRTAQRRRWWAVAPLAAAALALLFVTARPGTSTDAENAPYIGVKGFPSVWVYVKREAETKLWDGKRAFHPGDRVRLKLDPGAFRRVAVYSARGEAPPELLFEGDVPPGQTSALPDAWELDAEPSAEKLFVVLSDEPVTPRWSEWKDGKTAPGLAVLTFTLPKSMAVEADASDGSP